MIYLRLHLFIESRQILQNCPKLSRVYLYFW